MRSAAQRADSASAVQASDLLRLRGISKSFGRNQVLKSVSLTVRPGEFLGLMGPNGAGKSTLIKVLSGLYSIDEGTITVEGATVRSLGSDPRVAFIHQDLGVVPDLSVNDNLWLGRGLQGSGRLYLGGRSERERSIEALERIGLSIDPRTRLGDLASGEQTLVAVARAVDRGARTIFIDEATSTLPPPEARRVLDSLHVAAAAGCAVVMVSHKLSEILDYCGRIVVLIDGQVTVDEPVAGLDRDGLVQRLLMEDSRLVERTPRTGGHEALLSFEGVRTDQLGPLDLTLNRGEVLGVTGLPGSGLHDLGYLATGRLRPTKGSIRRAPHVKTSLLPAKRETQGGFNEMAVKQNMTIAALRSWRARGSRLLNLRSETKDAEAMTSRLSVVPAEVSTPYGVLSGGNKQKVIFGRLLFTHPDVYILCEPTRGVDVKTRMEIYSLINEVASNGASVLVLSSDAEDILSVCDRVSVIHDGRLDPFVPVGDLTAHELERLL